MKVDTKSSKFEAAKLYTSLGWVVHPLFPPDASVPSPGKQPILKEWQNRNVASEKELITWFEDHDFNIGLVAGKKSNVLVIDYDHDLFWSLLIAGIPLNTLQSFRTIGRGHVFFTYTDEFPSQKHHLLGIEILSDGSNVVLPPSQHKDGHIYQWVNPNAPINPMPFKLKKRLQELFTAEKKLLAALADVRPCFKKLWNNGQPPPLYGGDGRYAMAAFTLELKAHGCDLMCIKILARLVYKDKYDPQTTETEYKNWKGKPWTCETIREKISGIISCDGCSLKNKSRSEALHETEYYLIFTEKPDGTKKYKGIAHKLFADDLIPIYHFKTLMDTDEILYYGDGYYHFNGEAIIKKESERALGEYLKTRDVNEILNHIRRSTYISRDEINKNRYILPLKNGLFDLNTYTLKDFDPNIIVTYSLPIEYIPDADCPKIKKFISEILRQEDIPIIQQFFGYTLYPVLPAHKSLWLYGIGRNGKSSLVKLLTSMLGHESVISIPIEELDGDHRFAIARLYGKLLNVSSEPGINKPLESTLFKKLIGGDIVSAEIKGQQRTIDFINFAKFIILGNSFPQVMDPSLAFWDRLIVVEFPRVFSNDFIPNITDKLIEEEGLSGFFNWCLEGLKQLRSNNFHFTTSKTTEQIKLLFEKASDPFMAFIEEKCILSPDAIISKRDLYSAFKEYCGGEQYGIIGMREFDKRLGKIRGITDTKARYGGKVVHCWCGIRVKTREEEEKEEEEERDSQHEKVLGSAKNVRNTIKSTMSTKKTREGLNVDNLKEGGESQYGKKKQGDNINVDNVDNVDFSLYLGNIKNKNKYKTDIEKVNKVKNVNIIIEGESLQSLTIVKKAICERCGEKGWIDHEWMHEGKKYKICTKCVRELRGGKR